jgi:hypothetical protein
MVGLTGREKAHSTTDFSLSFHALTQKKRASVVTAKQTGLIPAWNRLLMRLDIAFICCQINNRLIHFSKPLAPYTCRVIMETKYSNKQGSTA